jgi:hypothetical protein
MSITPIQASEILPFILAYANGEEIEWRTCTECQWLPWDSTNPPNPGFTLGAHCYRIKPRVVMTEKEKFVLWLRAEIEDGLRDFRVLFDPTNYNRDVSEEDFFKELNDFNAAAEDPARCRPFDDSYLEYIWPYNPLKSLNFSTYISRSAVVVGDKVYVGIRHSDCFAIMKKDGVPKAGNVDNQGFVDNYGNYLSRVDALYMVRKTGQLSKPLIGSVLTSEDLWDNEGNPL